MKTLQLVALLIAAAAGSACRETRPLVATREGLVRGVIRMSAAGAVYYSFKGVRYAQPPVGALRFRPPQRHPGWSDVADAMDHGSHCSQFDLLNNNVPDGSEDCLFANVYTPQLPDLKGQIGGLPVMVFVHGGGFIFGHGDESLQGQQYFMDEDVVLVTLNYRLGAFGFLTTHDSSAPGNYGMLDQVMLLQWVRDNIASFGGDPSSVTIFGESAGGASVSLLVLSPLAKGLFDHAISQSGASMAPFAASGQRKGSARKLAKHLNCSTEDVPAMVECIKGVSAEALKNASQAITGSKFPFLPRVDIEAVDPFLPDDPRNLLDMGNFNLVPWMSGLTEEEGGLFLVDVLANETALSALSAGDRTQWSISADLRGPSDSPVFDCGSDPTEEVDKVYKFYVGNTSVSRDNLLPLARLYSDRIFVVSISEEIRLASVHTPIYKYVLDHKGPGRQRIADGWGFAIPDTGVTHGDDLMYLFGMHGQPLHTADSPARTMIRFMVSVWTNFARTGRPSSHVLPMPDWPIFTESSQRHMRLNSQPSVGARAFEERVAFWRTVPVNEPWRRAVRTDPCPQDLDES